SQLVFAARAYLPIVVRTRCSAPGRVTMEKRQENLDIFQPALCRYHGAVGRNQEHRTIAARPEIPQYALYGEAVQDVDERFLHVESIAERSALHDWTIRPHAHRDLHHLLLVQKGGGVLHVEDEEHAFHAPT